MKYGDDWKQIAEEIGFKNKREAILEFLRVPIDDSKREDSNYIKDYTYTPATELKNLKEIEPYN